MASARAAAVSVVFALCSVAAVPPPAMPHPAPIVRAKVTDNGACEGCHASIAAEWRQSLHHAAFTDPDFQRAIGHEPDPFCRGCHAPERDEALGVDCVTCHVTSADVLAVPGTARAPHALTRTPELASDAACARCHEFDFPDSRLRRRPLAMQRTVTEHAGRGDTCATCHMTKRDGHADHRFGASRDEAFVRSAVTVRAERSSPGTIEVALAPAHVGHAFPTGDLFRRVQVSVGSTSRYLARHYAFRQEIPGVVVRTETGDDRVQGGERLLVFPGQPDKTRVRIVYERADGPSDPAGTRVHVSGSIVLFDEEL